MDKEIKFLKYIQQFNTITKENLYKYAYRFQLNHQEAILLLENNGWLYNLETKIYLNVNKVDPNSLLENTDFKTKEYNTKKIKYKRK